MEGTLLTGAYRCRLLDTRDGDGYVKLLPRDAALNVDSGVSTLGGDPRPIPEVLGRMAIRSGIGGIPHGPTTVITAAHLGCGRLSSFTKWSMAYASVSCARNLLFGVAT